MPQPIYTSENTNFAYQLRWGVTVHWETPVDESAWLAPARTILESDGIRILSWRWLSFASCQIAISTPPCVNPQFIIQRLKGRIQYVVRAHAPKAFRPHYALRSFGSQERAIIENYVGKQTEHHQMATAKSHRIFEDLQFNDDKIDLSIAQKTTHGIYWYNLHIVLVNASRWCDVNQERLQRIKRILLQSGDQRGWRISRLSILADHLHVTVGCSLEYSPESVVLSMMNNIAWVYDMKPMLQYSAFVATFGEYDHRAIQSVIDGSR
jgi:REP element-mobilizing transposase RayT